MAALHRALHRPTLPSGDMAHVLPDLPVFESGPESSPLLVFVHGWPDDERLFSAQAEHFSRTHRVALIRLPWFSSAKVADADAAERSYSRWGYDLDQLGAAVVAAVSKILSRRSKPGPPPRATIIGHDWGGVITEIAYLARPDLFERVVLLDVCLMTWMITGPTRQLSEVKGMALSSAIYMGHLAVCFFVAAAVPYGRAPAELISRFFARIMTRKYLWDMPGGRAAAQRNPRAPNSTPAAQGIHPLSGAVYFYLLLSYVRGFVGLGLSRGRKVVVPAAHVIADPLERTQCPLLFVYGASKPGMFHQRRWVERIEARKDGSRVECFKDAGHWFMIEEPDRTNALLENWLQETDPGRST